VPTVLVDEEHNDEHPPEPDEIQQKIAAGDFFWMDVKKPDRHDHDRLVNCLGLAEDLVSEAMRMHQRPRIIDLDEGLAMIVLYAISDRARHPVEVHILVAECFVVTIHDSSVSALEVVKNHHRTATKNQPVPPLVVVHQVVDSIADGFFPRLTKVDDEIDSIEEEIFDTPTDEQLQRLFAMKRELIAMRKVVTPMRDMLGGVFTGVVELPGFTTETSGWLRDAYDHMIRISDLLDSYRDLLTGAMDVYLSTVSNRLNSVMKQLTVIATIFLPLTFITGFFGQNFLYLVNHIQRSWTFWVFAVGVEGAIVLAMLLVFKRRKWL
jgi:magnesium transporter